MAGGGSFVTNISQIRGQLGQNSTSQICIFKENRRPMPTISIGLGLYHQDVKHMEKLKDTALDFIVEQTRDREKDQLIQNVENLLLGIEACYEDNTEYTTTDRWQRATNFARDACFILYLFSYRDGRLDNDIQWAGVIGDIFMLANQIPLFLLVEIMRLYSNPNGAAATFVQGLTNYPPFRTLSPLALSCENDIINFLMPQDTISFLLQSRHLLHLLHKSIGHFLKVPDGHTTAGLTTPHQAPLGCGYALRNLEKYNIAFEAWNGRVEFRKRTFPWSILYLPTIRIEVDTDPFHKSLMAFDWKLRRDCTFINDLTFLLDCMVGEGNKDLFWKARIIQGDIEGICQRLRSLCSDLTMYYAGTGYHGGVYRKEIINELDEHSKKLWNEWMYTAWKWKGTILSALLTVVIAALTLMYTVWNWKGVLLSLGVLLLLVIGGLVLRCLNS